MRLPAPASAVLTTIVEAVAPFGAALAWLPLVPEPPAEPVHEVTR
ncbi:hypothetical protein [Actinocorallia longicatena]|uniref:Uncharacterized protein n=1 Tax=Actinocorallia longicatena TaxID=111803 RepID=A0ABP6Q865_9ACTN